MSFNEEKTGGRTVYKGKILRLDVDEVRLSDGHVAGREIIRHAGGAAVLYVKDGKVLLVKQFRYAYGKEIYEIPAGMINAGETPVEAAARELREETGYLGELSPLGYIYPSPGYTDEVIYLFSVKSAVQTVQDLDDGEFLSAAFIPLKEVEAMISRGEIADAKTVTAVLKYLLENK